MKDLHERIPCSVSFELVAMIANLYPDKFKLDGVTFNIPKILFTLGFKLDSSMKSQGFYKISDVLIRDNERPSKVYKTCAVYNGEVRNTILRYDDQGGPEYSRQKHSLCPVYEKFEILQPTNLMNHVPEEQWLDILDIGERYYYDNGFAAMDKPNSQSTRNIVRN